MPKNREFHSDPVCTEPIRNFPMNVFQGNPQFYLEIAALVYLHLMNCPCQDTRACFLGIFATKRQEEIAGIRMTMSQVYVQKNLPFLDVPCPFLSQTIVIGRKLQSTQEDGQQRKDEHIATKSRNSRLRTHWQLVGRWLCSIGYPPRIDSSPSPLLRSPGQKTARDCTWVWSSLRTRVAQGFSAQTCPEHPQKPHA